MRVWWTILALACAGDAQEVVQGQVVDGDVGVAGVQVSVGTSVGWTDPDGRFAIAAYGEERVPTAVLGPIDAHTTWGCSGDQVVLPVADEAPPTVPVEIVLRDVEGIPSGWLLHVVWTDARGETVRSRELPETWRSVDVEAGVWALSVDAPAEGPWALTAITQRGPGLGLEIDQAVFLFEAEPPAQDAVYDVLMSRETVRRAVRWDGQAPPGLVSLRVVQRVRVFDLVADVPVWEGVPSPDTEVPIVLVRAEDPVVVRSEVITSGRGGCARQVVSAPARLEVTGEGERLVLPTDLAVAPAVVVSGDLRRPTLGLRDVPAVATLSGALTIGAVTWSWAGDGGCGDQDLIYPPPLASGTGKIGGTVAWVDGDVEAACDVLVQAED